MNQFLYILLVSRLWYNDILRIKYFRSMLYAVIEARGWKNCPKSENLPETKSRANEKLWGQFLKPRDSITHTTYTTEVLYSFYNSTIIFHHKYTTRNPQVRVKNANARDMTWAASRHWTKHDIWLVLTIVRGKNHVKVSWASWQFRSLSELEALEVLDFWL